MNTDNKSPVRCDRCKGPLVPSKTRKDEFYGWCEQCQDYGPRVSSEQVAVPAVVKPRPSKSVAFDIMWRALVNISYIRPFDRHEGFIAEDAERMQDIANSAMKAVMKAIASDLNHADAAVLPSNTGDQP